ncbi:cytochrome c biogenesis protein [Spongiivirga citrea]|uniref:Cytochrome C biogenesis protein n=1 Tax=Spongiivirga citrea TaxID=1481457 RepID=A0A6M0CKA0_9FLAO|nr:cytochrome c biogenesis protein CcsA [Spongiivirga citrea]NER16329.1 cytochrome C biogenesis protein [Spongiivirga citrea]
MENAIAKVLFSTRLTAVLFIVFAIAMGLGTFVESWYSTETARAWIYNAWWFEAIMIFFVVNFLGNIFRYQLHKKEKWSILTIHLSFILILVGAFVTRYISYEGVMPIREGEASDYMLTEKTYATFFIDGDIDGKAMRKTLQEDVLLTPETSNNFKYDSDFNGVPFTIEMVDFIDGAEETLVEAETGKNYLKIVESSGGTRHDHFLEEGQVTSIHNILFALNNPTKGAINIDTTGEEYTIDSPFEGEFLRMRDQLKGNLVKDSIQPLQLRSLYTTAGMQFVIPNLLIKGVYDVVDVPENENKPDAIVVDITSGNEKKQLKVLGGKGFNQPPKQTMVNGLEFYATYGSLRKQLPFSLKLNDFIAEKYPGTEQSYSSFMSKVTVQDTESYDYDIYMNHVLDHGGYRFFQAQFDPDEKGTILSVSHDFWGTWITYIGYFLLYIGLLWVLFDRKARVADLNRMLAKIKEKKAALTLLFLFGLSFTVSAQEHGPNDGHDHSQEQEVRVENGNVVQEEKPADITAHNHFAKPDTKLTTEQLDSIIIANAVSKEHAAKFGKLVIQDLGGRMKPANTYSSEFLRKLSKKDEYKGLDANQVLISMVENPAIWYNIPLIKMKWENDSIRKIIGVESMENATFLDFFNEKGEYKLSPYLQDAYRAAVPNSFQKGFKDADQKLSLISSALDGEVLKLFPVPNSPNNKWVSYPELKEYSFKDKDSLIAYKVLPSYFFTLRDARKNNNYEESDQLLSIVKEYQKMRGAEVIPSEEKIEAEYLYNKYNIFQKLYRYYAVFGVLMFIFLIVYIFKESKGIKITYNVFKVGIVLLFVAHTAGLIARWYISGHAPWSDAYESILYVAWATMGIGLIFMRKSDMTVAASGFVTALLLWVAHQSWTDPAIANLQPVLDSYWLMIHVAVIVASYGPFTVGFILGTVSLLLMLLTNTKNKKKMDLNIKELTIINELALTVGLVMLTIGNFLGGQWANESWGRYWGWDPKETWALISIMIYAFVIHMRLVPGLRGRWLFNLMGIAAFGSIMMTYFGVNFYLSGLHSYASGEKIVTPSFVYYAVAGVAILGTASYFPYKKYYKKK